MGRPLLYFIEIISGSSNSTSFNFDKLYSREHLSKIWTLMKLQKQLKTISVLKDCTICLMNVTIEENL